jgi:CRISPR system Cascade subunit CasC
VALIQFHVLCDYGPNVLNRDDTGAPKTATIGGVLRQRISSQCLKNALRSSLMLEPELAGRFGKRTRWLGQEIERHLLSANVDAATATAVAHDVAAHYGAMKAPLQSTTLTFLSPDELQAACAIAAEVAAGKRVRPAATTGDTNGKGKRGKSKDTDKPWLPLDQLLLQTDSAIDVALFGRMLADHKSYSVEAAARFSHAFTTHRAAIDGDYFTGQDHVVQDSEAETGAGHLDVQQFGAGVFYQFVTVDTDLLVANLAGNAKLALTATLGLALGLIRITPPAKRTAFAADSYASYVLVEIGYDVARSLAGAFTVPVRGADYVGESIAALRNYRANLAAAEGAWGQQSVERIATPTESAGTTEGVLTLCAEAFRLPRPTGTSLVARVVAEATKEGALA